MFQMFEPNFCFQSTYQANSQTSANITAELETLRTFYWNRCTKTQHKLKQDQGRDQCSKALFKVKYVNGWYF